MHLVFCCICDVSYACLEACDYRAFVASMTNRRGHWVCGTSACWMSMGGKNTASNSVEHVVEVTVKRRLFLVTIITPISTLKLIWSRRRPVKGLSVSGAWKILITCWLYEYLVDKEQPTFKEEKKKYKIFVQWLSATLDLLFRASLLALSHSGRHERTTV